jgi:hypothetical protein
LSLARKKCVRPVIVPPLPTPQNDRIDALIHLLPDLGPVVRSCALGFAGLAN